ncbi:MAG: glycosyltransferase [Chitinophagaceae bacterium]|nr:glycosyltransferase [Chitinophagaceae bacterium]MCW5928654.1 glycosyltransferase [Chitinophagaceae bacterium]
MRRICQTLGCNGYNVTLVGRRTKGAPVLTQRDYKQIRLFCIFSKGKLFYLEFNIKLFFHLLFRKMDIICAIDLDTIVPVYIVSKIKGIKRVYDAHELFTEMKEVISRPNIHRFWKWIAGRTIPFFKNGYTVSQSIANTLQKEYQVSYELIRNCPDLLPAPVRPSGNKRFILYQGAVNEARGMEWLIPAMNYVDAELHIYGNGNFLKQTQELIRQNNLSEKVFIHPPVPPQELPAITAGAYIGINLVENIGLNQYYSLANKFFDYIQSGVPQVSMLYPEYANINNHYEVGILIENLDEHSISQAINLLLYNRELYVKLQNNCMKARLVYNWQEEEQKLLSFYQNLFT